MLILTHRRASVRAGLIAATLLLGAACRSPQSDAYLIEQIRQMGDELNASRQQASDLQSQLDSLRGVVARQDTLLTRIAGMAGIQR
jgi:hypothetical protein